MAEYSGLCAGGPLNGKNFVASAKRVNIPILRSGKVKIGNYKYYDGIFMWIWEGNWPIVPESKNNDERNFLK